MELSSSSQNRGSKRNRSASVAWIDFLTTPLGEDTKEDRRPSVPVYDKYGEKESPVTIDEEMFAMFEEEGGFVLAGKLLAALQKSGLKSSDPRLTELYENLEILLREQEIMHRGRPGDEEFVGSIETLRLDQEQFKECILPNIIVISAAFRQQFIIPKFERFCEKIEDLYLDCKEVDTGCNYKSIKHLRKMDPEYWGVSLCTIDGQRYSVGDTNIPVTLQSVGKPFMYGMALNELDCSTVHKYVGQEPSGHSFNELVLDYAGRPHNPMITAGALMVHSLLLYGRKEKIGASDIYDYTHELFTKLAGGEYIGFNNGVFLARRQASDRNWALAHYMRENDCFPKDDDLDLGDIIDYYLQVFSFEMTCEVLSVMAATLANGGVCPTTGERVFKENVVADVLSVLYSCGMLSYAGKFSFEIGLPSKSSVSGLMMLVVPNVMGMAMWSPQINTFSISSRALDFSKKLVKTFSFHLYENLTLELKEKDPTRKTTETKGSNTIILLFAAGAGDLNSIIRLHISGVDMGLYDFDERTALHISACEGHYEIVEYLLYQCGVDHTRKDRWGNTPYDEAVNFNHMEIAKLLRNWEP